MQKLTKIVATISDQNCEIDSLKKLHEAGMNVVRLNTAHQNQEDTLKVIKNVRAVSEKIALLIDTKGPEIRTTNVAEEIKVECGEKIKVTGNPNQLSTRDMICVSYPYLVKDVPVKSRILIDDGEIELYVREKNDDYLTCEVQNQGIIEGRKSVNIPFVHINLPSLSDKDREFVKFAIAQDVEFIAHSFVRNKTDVLAIQEILDEHNSNIKIISKIENQDGIDNIDEILVHSYGIMIARGDLAIEVPRERIPIIQKKLINKCIEKRKTVIVATQMLHSMIKNPRPTRAEVTDIATAIFEGTDAIMLSGETAYGKYPLEAVQTMTKIALEIEKEKAGFVNTKYAVLTNETSAYLSKVAVKTALRMQADAIIADTTTGRTVRNAAGFRGEVPVLAITYSKRTMRELALSYGIYSKYMEPMVHHDEFLKSSITKLVSCNMIKPEHNLVILAGSFGKSRGANFVQYVKAQDILDIEFNAKYLKRLPKI